MPRSSGDSRRLDQEYYNTPRPCSRPCPFRAPRTNTFPITSRSPRTKDEGQRTKRTAIVSSFVFRPNEPDTSFRRRILAARLALIRGVLWSGRLGDLLQRL